MKNKIILRVAGVCSYNGKVLLHRCESDEFWALPGGKCEFGEDSSEAIHREFKEELNAEIELGKIAWFVENFFNYDGTSFQEVGFYYQYRFKGSSIHLYEKQEFYGSEDFFEKKNESLKLHFKWFSEDELLQIDLRPKLLKNELFKIPNEIKHIINRDDSAI
jgi:ADP-ribose pyrophosphatase YjhB (NUDIX family)